MVSSSHPVAAEAALRALEPGGTTADAYITAAFAQVVLEPTMTTLGGGWWIHDYLKVWREVRMSRITSQSLSGLCIVALLLLGLAPTPASAQTPKKFGDLAEGPYNRLVIQGAMVIPGWGGPPIGPYDIIIEKNIIKEMIAFDPVSAERRGHTERPTGDRVIEATGMYVMPGLIDLHNHIRQEPMPMEYLHYLRLAHGVTTYSPAADRGLTQALEQKKLSEENEILSPRLYPLCSWGEDLL